MKVKIEYEYLGKNHPYPCKASATIDGEKIWSNYDSFEEAKAILIEKIKKIQTNTEPPKPEEVEI